MTPEEALKVMLEVDVFWPDAKTPIDNPEAVRLWVEHLAPFPYQVARQSLFAFGGQQARAPSIAQIIGECRVLAGEGLPAADSVLAEFARVNREHSAIYGRADWACFSSSAVAAFALSGAFRDWGMTIDANGDERLAASEAADRASIRRRWDDHAANVRRFGLSEATRRLGAGSPEPEQIGGALARLNPGASEPLG